MGPENPSEEEVSVVVSYIAEYLRNEHGLLMGLEEDLNNSMRQHRILVMSQLKDVVRNIIWQDRCENF